MKEKSSKKESNKEKKQQEGARTASVSREDLKVDSEAFVDMFKPPYWNKEFSIMQP